MRLQHEPMPLWGVDALIAVWITLLDVLLVLGYAIYEGIRNWPSEACSGVLLTRLSVVLTIVAACFGAAGLGFCRAGLRITAATQVVLGGLVLAYLLRGLSMEAGRRGMRRLERRRLRRERYRWHGL